MMVYHTQVGAKSPEIERVGKMALIAMKELLLEAAANKYAVGGFEFWSLDSVRAIIEAAEEFEKCVILQAGPYEIEYMGLKNVERAVKYMAEQSSVKIALHLDHSTDTKWVKYAIDNGFTSVMIDASALSFEENIELTQETVALASPYGVTVEAELGRVPGEEGDIMLNESEAYQTNVDEAVVFVKQTGIDCLAVAVGTAHGVYRSLPKINLTRIGELCTALDVPLVLHGGSGIPDDTVIKAIKAGISKINVCTEFMDAFGKSYNSGYKPSVRGLFEPGYLAGKEVIKEKIKLFSGM